MATAADALAETDEEALRRTAPMATLDIVPQVACVQQMGNIHTTATTRNWQWVFTAGSEGIVRKYDFFGSMNGKQVLRQQQQRHGFIDSLTKGGVLLSSWENDTPRSTSMFVYNNKVQIPPIFCSAVHSEGLWLLTGQKNPLVDKSQPVTADVPVKLWTVRIYEGRCMHEFRHHKATVSAIALEPDEQAFVSGSWDKTVQRCDLHTGQVTRSFLAHTSYVTSVSFAPAQSSTSASPLLLSAGLDGTAYCWDMRQEKPARSLVTTGSNQASWIISACWGATGEEVYCGRRNGTVDEWNASSGVYSKTLKLPLGANAVSTLAAFPDKKHLFVASEDNVRIWNVAEVAPKGATPYQILPTHSGATVSSVCIDEDMKYMVTSSGDRGIQGTTDKLTIMYEIRPPALS